jgi:hypothetical protein
MENIQLNRNAIPQTLFNFIKEELNFLNTEFIIKNTQSGQTSISGNQSDQF